MIYRRLARLCALSTAALMLVYGGAAAADSATAMAAGPQAAVDPSLPDYVPRAQVGGRVSGQTGMDTVENMMHAWAEAFRKWQPGADVSVTMKDGLAPEDRIGLGPKVDEVFSPSELAYENAYGYEPFRVKICAGAYKLKSHVSAIGVYVNKNNPIASLSLPQLDAVFSAERRRGYPADITTWGQLGLTGPWADAPIHLYGFYWRDDVTSEFRRLAMLGAPFKPTYQVPGGDMSRHTPVVAQAIMSAMAQDPYGITFANASYETDEVKTIGLSANGVQSQFSPGDVASGRYPLQRYLYIYVHRVPGQPLDPLLKEFLRFVLSKQGQMLVARDHYLPLPAAVVAEELAKLE